MTPQHENYRTSWITVDRALLQLLELNLSRTDDAFFGLLTLRGQLRKQIDELKADINTQIDARTV